MPKDLGAQPNRRSNVIARTLKLSMKKQTCSTKRTREPQTIFVFFKKQLKLARNIGDEHIEAECYADKGGLQVYMGQYNYTVPCTPVLQQVSCYKRACVTS